MASISVTTKLYITELCTRVGPIDPLLSDRNSSSLSVMGRLNIYITSPAVGVPKRQSILQPSNFDSPTIGYATYITVLIIYIY